MSVSLRPRCRRVRGAHRASELRRRRGHGRSAGQRCSSEPDRAERPVHATIRRRHGRRASHRDAKGERGDHDTSVNAPLRPGDGGDQFRAAFESVILPRRRAFRPDLLVISAGFDAHMRDPLANLNLLEADFDWATRKLM